MKRIEVAAGLLIRGQRFLAAQRPPEDAWAGFWEFPGGKLESGETAAEALIRELAEEIGVTVLASQMLLTSDYAYPEFGVRLHFLHVTEYTGETMGREGQLLAWVSAVEAQTLPFLPADAPLLAKSMEVLEEGGCTHRTRPSASVSSDMPFGA